MSDPTLLTNLENTLALLPSNVVMTEYGNCNGRGSLVEPDWSLKSDPKKNAKVFDMARIEKALVEIPNKFMKRKTFNRSKTSYGLKHELERETSYITNGDFILSMLMSGFRARFAGEVNPIFDVK